MKNIEQFTIRQKGFEIAITAIKLTTHFPPAQKSGLPLTKAAISSPSDIGQDSKQSAKNDNIRFPEISPGSSFETGTQRRIAKTANFGAGDLIDLLLKHIDEEQKMIMSFMRKSKVHFSRLMAQNS